MIKTIKIVHKPAKYVIISQTCAEDNRLSWGARGLFLYLHGRPEGWKINFKNLKNRSSSDGKSKLNKYIKELQRYGYLKIEKIKDEAGRFKGAIWKSDDEPETVGLPAETVDNSQSAPCSGKPFHGKTVQRKISGIQINKRTIKQKTTTIDNPVVEIENDKKNQPPCSSMPPRRLLWGFTPSRMPQNR